MTTRTVLSCFLSMLAGLLLLLSGVGAASANCTPVVYAFRHAEDADKPVSPPFPCLSGSSVLCSTALTPVGMMHANLYVEMVANLEMKEDFCPLRGIYAVSPIKPDGSGGTTNPFQTGKPLADALTDLDPFVDIDGKGLDQNLKVADRRILHTILISAARSGASSALFWTSEGLRDLGEALGTQVIPAKGGGSPPRNAAYLFKYNGGEKLVQPKSATEYVQCFNYTNNGDPKRNFGSRFYCGAPNNGNLSTPEKDFDKLHARICDLNDPGFKKMDASSGYLGYCESPTPP
jgi:hypothetical protein